MLDRPEPERDLGPQPLGALLVQHGLAAHDLVAKSTDQLTHKMVARAVKGRRLTRNTMDKVLAALNEASGKHYGTADAFNYSPVGPVAIHDPARRPPVDPTGESSAPR